ncbi:MAG: LptE family protein [Lentisphaerae bacterium]|nr:LptE family protein [Lentisphaerota bacterium]
MKTRFQNAHYILLLACVLSGGCLGYRLGTSLPPGIKTLHVPMFANRSDQPQIESEITGAVIREFQKDGTLKIVGKEDADAVLSATITKYELLPVSYDSEDRKRINEYRLCITAEIAFTDRSTGKPLLRRKLVGENYLQVQGDITAAKSQALPSAAADMAHNIVECVVDYWP